MYLNNLHNEYKTGESLTSPWKLNIGEAKIKINVPPVENGVTEPRKNPRDWKAHEVETNRHAWHTESGHPGVVEWMGSSSRHSLGISLFLIAIALAIVPGILAAIWGSMTLPTQPPLIGPLVNT